MRVTITIDEGEARTVVSAGEGAMAGTETGTDQASGAEPIDGGAARAVADFEGSEVERGGPMEDPQEGRAGPIDAGPAPVLASADDGHGPLPLGRSTD